MQGSNLTTFRRCIIINHMASVGRRLAPLVIAGPSAVGKGRLIRTFLEKESHRFQPCLSYTTRAMRKEEREGVDYYFISKQEFERKIRDGEMIEHENVHGNYYGKSIRVFEQIQRRGRIPIFDIDVRGAKTVHSLMQANCLFLLPPSMRVLIERMRGRGSETSQSMRERLQTGRREMEDARSSGIFAFMVCYQQGLSQLGLRYYIDSRYDVKYGWLL